MLGEAWGSHETAALGPPGEGSRKSFAGRRNVDDLVATTEGPHAEAEEFRRRVVANEHGGASLGALAHDGNIVDVELLAAPMLADGEPVGTFAIYHDITELNRQRRFFDALTGREPGGDRLRRPDARVTSWNPAAEKLFGYRRRRSRRRDRGSRRCEG